MKKAFILVLTNFFILTLILGKPAKAQTTEITEQFLYGLQLYVLPEKTTPPDYSTAIYSSTINENDFLTSGLYQNWLQPRLPDNINGYVYLVDSSHTIKNVYLGGGYLEQGQTLSYPYEPSIEMKHYGAPLIDIFILNPVNRSFFETPTLDYIVYYENNDGTTPRIKLIDASLNENDYNRVKLAINGYDTGYNAGYFTGYNNGQVDGYNNGYNAGDTNGYNRGYNAGQYDFYNEYYQQIYDEGYNAGLGDKQIGVNSVVNFNQLVLSTNINDWESIYGTKTQESENVIKYTLNVVGSYAQNRIQSTPYNYVENHKYLLTLKAKGVESSLYFASYSSAIGDLIYDYTFMGNINENYNDIFLFFSANADYTNCDIRLSIGYTDKQIGDIFYFKNIMLFDLTQIYGVGNEPNNYNTFKDLFYSDYYPYTTSELINIDYENGYITGKNDGYPLGYDDGVSYQATQQLTSDGWIKNIFTGIGAFLGIEILPNVTIGLILGIPFIITVAWFVLKMARGGSAE